MLYLIAAIHMLPPDVLNTAGIISDVVSDVSPTIFRPFLHMMFSVLLN